MKITYLLFLSTIFTSIAFGDDPSALPLKSVAVWIDCHEATPKTTAYFTFSVSSATGLNSKNEIEEKPIASLKKAPLVNSQSAIPSPYVYVHQSMVANLTLTDEGKAATLKDFQGVASFKDFSHPGETKRDVWGFSVQGTSTELKKPSIQADFVVQFIFGDGSNRLVKYLRYPGGNTIGKTYSLGSSGSGSYLNFNAVDFTSDPSGFPVDGSSQNSSYYSPSNPPEQEPTNTKKTGAPLHKTTLPETHADSGTKRNTGN